MAVYDIHSPAKTPKTTRVLHAFKSASASRFTRWAIFAAIFGYLAFQLSKIGFNEIAAALPTSPLFYLLSIGFVAVPVMSEIFAFRTISGEKADGGYKIFLRKQVLNKAVMNFSGDAFLIQKLSQQNGMSLKRAAIILKDMTLIRGFSANLWIIILAGVAVMSGNLDVLQNFAAASPGLVIFVSLFCLSIVGGAILLFRKLTQLKSRTALKVAAIYLARAVVIGGILIAQWSLASPGTAIADWFIFLIIFSLAKKSPVGGELLFASIVVSILGLAAGSAEIAAMLIAIAAVTQVIYALGFLLSAQRDKPAVPKSVTASSLCSPCYGPARYS
ncbi:MAG: hypothetical protein ABJO36_11280 [Litorimonas sp.]